MSAFPAKKTSGRILIAPRPLNGKIHSTAQWKDIAGSSGAERVANPHLRRETAI
ncbi:MAG: hypothetical protein AAGC76_13740 [Luteibacter sp.]|jgi:hypothetical protein|uniref:hypothetical protein n=1 Tax=Luteibacter sp. TaxID=1886636 RepID=UPI002809C76A|nr:hypothetical protein [Luteibacter sp.]MDQ7996896.1 hypothetical protein [Luteibacter sp.]MDQ8049267.1 hypothetical protein [Luteibacter sp.]